MPDGMSKDTFLLYRTGRKSQGKVEKKIDGAQKSCYNIKADNVALEDQKSAAKAKINDICLRGSVGSPWATIHISALCADKMSGAALRS